MKLTPEMSKIVAELEYLIGSECYNPNSYDGWNDIEGCDFRYPISLPNNEGKYKKIRGNLNTSPLLTIDEITPSSVSYMKYRFGSNELFIGKGIINVLNFLEKRYGISFNDLEAARNDGLNDTNDSE